MTDYWGRQYVVEVRQAQHSGAIEVTGTADALAALVKTINAALVGGPGCHVRFTAVLQMTVDVHPETEEGGDDDGTH